MSRVRLLSVQGPADRRAKPVTIRPNQPRARRFPFVATIELAEVDSPLSVKEQTTDLSLYGCHVSTRRLWAKGTKVRIRIIHNGMAFAALAEITHVAAGSGVGIRFAHIEPSAQAMLDNWIAELRKRTI